MKIRNKNTHTLEDTLSRKIAYKIESLRVTCTHKHMHTHTGVHTSCRIHKLQDICIIRTNTHRHSPNTHSHSPNTHRNSPSCKMYMSWNIYLTTYAAPTHTAIHKIQTAIHSVVRYIYIMIYKSYNVCSPNTHRHSPNQTWCKHMRHMRTRCLETYENTQQKHTHSKMHSHVWGHTRAHALEDKFSCVGHTRAHALEHTFSRVEAHTCTCTSDRGVHALDTAGHVQKKRIDPW